VEATSPDITSATLTGAKITFVGTNFPDFTKTDAHVTYKGVSASAAYTTTTGAEVTFPKGLPFSAAAAAPVLIFKQKTLAAGVTIAYSITSRNTTTVTVANPVPASPTSTAVSCSYAGGCKIEITGAGFSSSLSTTGNGITVCGNNCPLSTDATETNGTKATCIVPPLSTT